MRVMGKGGKERLVPMGEEAVHWLESYLQEARSTLLDGRRCDAVFVTRRGTGMTRQAFWYLIKRYARKAGRADCACGENGSCRTRERRGGCGFPHTEQFQDRRFDVGRRERPAPCPAQAARKRRCGRETVSCIAGKFRRQPGDQDADR